MKLGFFLIFSAFTLLAACKSENFKIQGHYLDMYVDLLVAHETYKTDTKKFHQAKNGTLKDYDFSYQDMQKHINEIENRPELWEEFQNEVLTRVKEIKANYKGE